MHVFGLRPLTDPLHLVRSSKCICSILTKIVLLVDTITEVLLLDKFVSNNFSHYKRVFVFLWSMSVFRKHEIRMIMI